MNIKMIAIVLVVLVLVMASTIMVTYSKFISTIDGTLSMSVAKPICNLILETQTSNLSNWKGCSVYFEVNNYNENYEISDVTMQYFICINFANISPEFYPEYKLYKIGEGSVEAEVTTTITTNGIQTLSYTINAGNMETQKYRLELSNPKAEDLLQLCLSLESIQIEPK